MNNTSEYRQPTQREASEYVRSCAFRAAIGALVASYLGFFHFNTNTGDDLFSLAGNVLLWTMRVGGVGLALIAVGYMAGIVATLAVDAVFIAIFGVAMGTSGIAMMMDGGDSLIALVFAVSGAFCLSSALGNWRSFTYLRGGTPRGQGGEVPYDPRFEERRRQETGEPPSESLGSQLLAKPRGGAAPGEVPLARPQEPPADVIKDDPPHDMPAVQPDTAGEVQADDPSVSSDDTPPEGFLASFADDDSPPRI